MVVMGWLEWMPLRWGEVHVPEMVWTELRRRSVREDWDTLEDARCQGWLRVTAITDTAAVEALGAEDLHPGECEAITLAGELHAACLIIDERDGRRAATKRHLPITGTVGMVLWAKVNGLIPSAREAMVELRRRANFFLDDGLIEHIAREAAEANIMDDSDGI
jgi:predicted nucleic acid-binding protein